MELQITEVVERELLYFDTRFDDPEDCEENFMSSPLDISYIYSFLEQWGRVEKCTYGHEKARITGKLHCHVRLELSIVPGSKKPPAGMSQSFKNYLKKRYKYVSDYMFIYKSPKKDLETFFQYLYKDYEEFDHIELDLQKGFTEDELKIMWVKAREVRRVSDEQYKKNQKSKEDDKKEWSCIKAYLKEKVSQTRILNYKNEVSSRFNNYYDLDIDACSIDNYKLSTFRYLQLEIGTQIINYYVDNHDSKIPYGNKVVSIFNRYCIQEGIFNSSDLASIIFRL